MKVLQIVPEFESGGVERGTLEVARYLVTQGHEAVVVSNGGKMVSDLETAGGRHVKLPVHRKSLLTFRMVPRLRELLRRERPDVVHVRSRVPGWVAWLAWRRMPVDRRPSLVSTVHGFYSVNRYSQIMLCGEKVICVSNSIHDYVIQNYPSVNREKLTIIHRGIDPAQYHAGYVPSDAWKAQWLQEFPQTKGKRWVVIPGRLTRLKGQIEFLEGFDQLRQTVPDLHALVVGGTHPRKQAYAEELRRLVAEKGMEKDVTFTGERGDLKEILAESEICYSLSRQPESFGRVALESLSLGTAVIGYDDGGVGEILGELLPEGILSREQPNGLIQKSEAFLRQRPQPKPNRKFLLDSMLSETLKLYQSLVHCGQTPAI